MEFSSVPTESDNKSADTSANQNDGSKIKLFDDFWQGFKQGTKDEIQFDQDHLVNTGVRTGLAAAGGQLMTDIRATCKSNVKTQATVGMILSTGHFLVSPGHLEDVTEKATATETHEKGLGYVAGRFLTDLGLTTATTATIGRVKWERGRESAVAEIFERESNPYWVRSHVGGRGPKTFPVSAHFSHRGLDLPTKDQSLVKFLTERNETHLHDPLFEKYKHLHKPELEGKYWTTRK